MIRGAHSSALGIFPIDVAAAVDGVVAGAGRAEPTAAMAISLFADPADREAVCCGRAVSVQVFSRGWNCRLSHRIQPGCEGRCRN